MSDTEALTLPGQHDLYQAIAAQLQTSIATLHQQLTLRGQGPEELGVYAGEYVRAEAQFVVDTLAGEGILNDRDDVLQVWDAYSEMRGWRAPGSGHWFPSATFNLRDATDPEPAPAAMAPPSITAADLAAARGTNSWEVVTAMAARLPRVYHARSGPQGIRTLVSDMGPRTRSTRS